MRTLPWLWLGFFIPMSVLFIGSDSSYHLETTLCSPSLQHPLGCDSFGRDMLTTLLRASGLSLLFAGFAASLGILGGMILGSLIVLLPPWGRSVCERGLEFFLSFPYLLIALGLVAVTGPGWSTLVVALLLGSLPMFTRLMLVRAKEVTHENYFLISRSNGAGHLHLMSFHLFPNLMGLASVKAPNLFAQAIMAEATLSFLGVGAPIGKDTLGALLLMGKNYLLEAPHIALTSGVPLAFTVFSLQILSSRLVRER